MTKGIDVSNHNGKIDWEAVKTSGLVDFALIRTGYGVSSPNQKDPYFEYNYSECKRLGIPIGAYHYSYATSTSAATEEAKFALGLLEGKSFEYPIYFDIEEERHVKLSRGLCTQIVQAFCTSLEAKGYWVGVYSFDSFFSTNLDASVRKRYATWVARTPKKSKDDGKTILIPSFDAGIHQYSFRGSISGVSGGVDLDICYKDYPSLIKAAHKNGYTAKSYTVTAVQKGLTEDKARETAVYLTKLGMTTSIKEG